MGTDSNRDDRDRQAIRLRKMTIEDLGAVLEIETAVQLNPWGQSAFVDCLRNGYDCAIAEWHGQVSGFGITMNTGCQADILNIGVALSHQRRGIGRSLLNELIENCRHSGVDEVFLEVRRENFPAINLYQAFGFCEAGSRPGYYPAGTGARESALIFRVVMNDTIRPGIS